MQKPASSAASERAAEQRARRAAMARGYRLLKFPARHRHHQQYGPYALASASNNWMVAWGFTDPQEVLDWVQERDENDAA